MTRYINADDIPYVTDETYLHEFDYAYRYAIDALPTVDAVPVVHGRWIDEHYYSEHKSEHVYRCSECGWHMIAYPDELFHYCPICCARMDAE